MKSAWIMSCVLAVGCGDNTAPGPDAASAMARGCSVAFSGDFVEQEPLGADCATIADGDVLTLTVPSIRRATTFAIAVQLPAQPLPGAYSSDTVTAWSALATQNLERSVCLFSGGSAAVPPGSFTLTLEAIDGATAHGQLMLELAVLAGAETDCGPSNVEDLAVSF